MLPQLASLVYATGLSPMNIMLEALSCVEVGIICYTGLGNQFSRGRHQWALLKVGPRFGGIPRPATFLTFMATGGLFTL